MQVSVAYNVFRISSKTLTTLDLNYPAHFVIWEKVETQTWNNHWNFLTVVDRDTAYKNKL